MLYYNHRAQLYCITHYVAYYILIETDAVYGESLQVEQKNQLLKAIQRDLAVNELGEEHVRNVERSYDSALRHGDVDATLAYSSNCTVGHFEETKQIVEESLKLLHRVQEDKGAIRTFRKQYTYKDSQAEIMDLFAWKVTGSNSACFDRHKWRKHAAKNPEQFRFLLPRVYTREQGRKQRELLNIGRVLYLFVHAYDLGWRVRKSGVHGYGLYQPSGACRRRSIQKGNLSVHGLRVLAKVTTYIKDYKSVIKYGSKYYHLLGPLAFANQRCELCCHAVFRKTCSEYDIVSCYLCYADDPPGRPALCAGEELFLFYNDSRCSPITSSASALSEYKCSGPLCVPQLRVK